MRLFRPRALYVCVYVCMCDVCMYVCTYVCMHACVYVCMRAYVCMYWEKKIHNIVQKLVVSIEQDNDVMWKRCVTRSLLVSLSLSLFLTLSLSLSLSNYLSWRGTKTYVCWADLISGTNTNTQRERETES